MFKLLVGKPFVLMLLLAGFAEVAFAQTPPSPQEAPAAPQKNEDVSSATGTSCHEDIAKKSSQQSHQIRETSKEKGWKDQSCGSWHGSGQAHVDAGDGSQIFVFTKVSAREVGKNCLSCHAKTEAHAGSPTSLH